MIRICFLLVFLLCSNHVVSGTGAGGIVKVINKSSFGLYVYWHASTVLGIPACGLHDPYLSLIFCEKMDIGREEELVYKYNWGVIHTWIRMHKHDDSSDSLVKHVHVSGWEMAECTITGRAWPVSVKCE